MDDGYGSPETYLACFQFFLAPTDLDGNNPDHTLRPHVIGNSWSCPSIEGCSGGEFAEVIATLKEAGVASILSASNDGPSCGSMGNPATDINVTSVASVKSDGTISSFSSRGPTTDGRVGPTISAPGSLVKSSTELSDSSYSTWSGTSMASPHVTGAWALVASLCPAYAYDVDATEALLLRHTVKDQVQVDNCGSDSDSSYPNNVYGAGLLDIYAAVSECVQKSSPTPTKSPFPAPSAAPTGSPTGSVSFMKAWISLSLMRKTLISCQLYIHTFHSQLLRQLRQHVTRQARLLFPPLRLRQHPHQQRHQ